MKNKWIWILVAGLGIADSARCDESNVLEHVRGEFSKIASVRAAFTQEKQLSLFKRTLVIKGRMLIDNQGSLLWRMDAPLRYAMTLRKGVLRQWDEESGKVQTLSLREIPAAAALLSNMQGWFTGNFESLKRDYTIRVEQESPVVISFKPRTAMPSFLKSVTLRMRDDARYIQEVRLVEFSGDSSTLRFEQVILNGEIMPSDWEIPPPHE